MSGKSICITILSIIASMLATYVVSREASRYEVVGTIVVNKTIVSAGGDGISEDNFIVIERADGTRVMYSNVDDIFIGKKNAAAIRNRLESGQLVEITCNGFGNVVDVTWLNDKDKNPKSSSTNTVEEVKK